MLETRGFDELADIKAQAADRWVKAVNADGQFGTWRYFMVRKPSDIADAISRATGASAVSDRPYH